MKCVMDIMSYPRTVNRAMMMVSSGREKNSPASPISAWAACQKHFLAPTATSSYAVPSSPLLLLFRHHMRCFSTLSTLTLGERLRCAAAADLSEDWCEVDGKGLPVSVSNVRAKVCPAPKAPFLYRGTRIDRCPPRPLPLARAARAARGARARRGGWRGADDTRRRRCGGGAGMDGRSARIA